MFCGKSLTHWTFADRRRLSAELESLEQRSEDVEEWKRQGVKKEREKKTQNFKAKKGWKTDKKDSIPEADAVGEVLAQLDKASQTLRTVSDYGHNQHELGLELELVANIELMPFYLPTLLRGDGIENLMLIWNPNSLD